MFFYDVLELDQLSVLCLEGNLVGGLHQGNQEEDANQGRHVSVELLLSQVENKNGGGVFGRGL